MKMSTLSILLLLLTLLLSPCTSQKSFVMFGNGVPNIQTSPSISFTELLRQRFDEGNTVQQVSLNWKV